jgi:hypothetical protein
VSRWLTCVIAGCLLPLACGLPGTGDAQDLVTLVNRVTSSVAFVVVTDAAGQPEGSGSAFLIGQDVLITALHVVEDASRVSVQFPEQPVAAADVIGIDIDHDVALLHVLTTPTPSPMPLALGNSHGAQLGEAVAVVGYPLASPDHPTVTVTQGIVSALRTHPDYIQIDAPINPGDSGGPVLESDGRVIGIVDASLRGAQNFNFAIPIDAAKSLIALPSGAPPLPLPLTSPLQVLLAHSGSGLDAYAHDEQEGISCVAPPPHAAALKELRVEMKVQTPLHMLAWLSWERGAPPEDAGTFARIDDTVSPELIKPLTNLDLQPNTVCLNYLAWNNTGGSAKRTYSVTYTLVYRVFTVPSTTSASH